MRMFFWLCLFSLQLLAQEGIYSTQPSKNEVKVDCAENSQIIIQKKDDRHFIFCRDKNGKRNGGYWETLIIPDKNVTKINNFVTVDKKDLGILLIKGQLSDGKSSGHWIFWKYLNEVDDIKFKYYRYEEGSYINDLRAGTWYEWKFSDLKGWIKEGTVGKYQQGLKNGKWTEFENSQPYIEIHYKNGKEINRIKVGFDQEDISDVPEE